MPIQMTVSQEQASRWDMLHLYAHFQNKIEGSRQLQVIHSLHEEPPTSLSFTTQENMIGDYSISLTVIAHSVNYSRRFCSFKIETSTSRIVVKNDPAVADILPPTVTDITFSKPQVKEGESLEFTFASSDKSGLCTMWQANDNSCSLGTHVRLDSQQGDPAIDFHYPTPIYQISGGKYLAVIPFLKI